LTLSDLRFRSCFVQKNADVVIATDPDCDRTGVAICTAGGERRLLAGKPNRIAIGQEMFGAPTGLPTGARTGLRTGCGAVDAIFACKTGQNVWLRKQKIET